MKRVPILMKSGINDSEIFCQKYNWKKFTCGFGNLADYQGEDLI